MVKKMKEIRAIKTNCGIMVLKSGTQVGCTAQEADEIMHDIMAGTPFVRKVGKIRRGFQQDVPVLEQFVKLMNKGTIRGQVCKILGSKGVISREEYKKFNRWGDNRWLMPFIEEVVKEGEVYYALRKEIVHGVKSIKR